MQVMNRRTDVLVTIVKFLRFLHLKVLKCYRNHYKKVLIDIIILTCLNQWKELSVTDGLTLIIEKLRFKRTVNLTITMENKNKKKQCALTSAQCFKLAKSFNNKLCSGCTPSNQGLFEWWRGQTIGLKGEYYTKISLKLNRTVDLGDLTNK